MRIFFCIMLWVESDLSIAMYYTNYVPSFTIYLCHFDIDLYFDI